MIQSKALMALILAAPAIAAIGCTKHEIEVKPIEIKPIYITLDIRIQQQVNQSLQFVEQERGITPTTVPATVAP
jgi:hypothetical protein